MDTIAKYDFEIYSSTSAIQRVADGMVTVICCILLTVPIIVLSYLTPLSWKLFVVVASTLAFSISLSIVSDAARKDIFSATAAFVAVQVVFLGASSPS